MKQCTQDKVVLKVGQRVKYLPDTNLKFYGNVEAINGDRVLVRWDKYEDCALDTHYRSELLVVPKSYGRH